jgi:hypothetical protein
VASAGEEAEQGPFAELGGHVTGLDVEDEGEFAWGPVAGWLAGDDGGGALVLVVAVVALCALIGRCAERQRACLQVLHTLVR